MDCTTCHQTHTSKRKNVTAYENFCQSCHLDSSSHFCKLANPSNISFLKNNCVNCHMSPIEAGGYALNSPKSSNEACSVVNHRIAIYPAQSKLLMDQFLKAGPK